MCDCWLAEVGWWAVVLPSAFLAYCLIGITMEAIEAAVVWVYERW